jgi:hypothetical protein
VLHQAVAVGVVGVAVRIHQRADIARGQSGSVPQCIQHFEREVFVTKRVDKQGLIMVGDQAAIAPSPAAPLIRVLQIGIVAVAEVMNPFLEITHCRHPSSRFSLRLPDIEAPRR